MSLGSPKNFPPKTSSVINYNDHLCIFNIFFIANNPLQLIGAGES